MAHFSDGALVWLAVTGVAGWLGLVRDFHFLI
jgi:hypothetical protein